MDLQAARARPDLSAVQQALRAVRQRVAILRQQRGLSENAYRGGQASLGDVIRVRALVTEAEVATRAYSYGLYEFVSHPKETRLASVIEVLRAARFGSRTAEDERERLKQYFVRTEQWSRVFDGDVDIVYGAKGSGKSAIYGLILDSEDELFDRRILVVPAENPQGAPAFKDISSDPPRVQSEFVDLWKLYILCIAAEHIKQLGYSSSNVATLLKRLKDADLLHTGFSLNKVLRYAFDYVRRLSAVEASVTIDQVTGLPTGLGGRISLKEPTVAQAKAGVVSLDEMFRIANNALEDAGYTLWICLDRLDVAFVDRPSLEADALRALFKCYLDVRHHPKVQLKIFLRSDIWRQISAGLREASHIERSLTIEWNEDSLMNLTVRRLLSNQKIADFYKIAPDMTLADFSSQQAFIKAVFPDQVESGGNKPQTFKWILGRTQDASGSNAPRELIHFLNELRDKQIKRLELRMPEPSDGRLFEQPSFKDALPAVSKARLELTLYAEFPALMPFVEKLKKQKAEQTNRNLADLWDVSEPEADRLANQLADVGFFKEIKASSGSTWWVPFLYRPALDLVQGSSE